VLRRRARRARTNLKPAAGAPGALAAGARLTFRAELMPGRQGAERTYTVARVLSNRRIELVGLSGQHAAGEFEPARP
jgi:hypothetical protein